MTVWQRAVIGVGGAVAVYLLAIPPWYYTVRLPSAQAAQARSLARWPLWRPPVLERVETGWVEVAAARDSAMIGSHDLRWSSGPFIDLPRLVVELSAVLVGAATLWLLLRRSRV